ncbi:alpha/beta hydrolase [Ramlibacter solisilvae]|uniref:Hydrolase n=1 Tax=Ramlibacter tataouinensis TaxID=94132 RepID=A0A127JSZ6_9BURK|nr:alpha/beta hydrolase [Ramlibacter tataouinensis]AMO23138.1 hydrolase [Ramlibacter tataouinensis]
MQAPIAFYREQGTGPGVVCLHSNASSSSQWRGLMELLAPSFRVIAADSYGAGKSPAWPVGRTLVLRDEVDLLEPAFAAAGDPFVLVGHSYGAGIALRAAVTQPQRVRALALYEPTLFALVDAQRPPPNDADGIKAAVARAGEALDRGDEDAAARHFIDFWMGEGAWAATPEARKPPIAAAVRNVRGWAHALVNEPTPLAHLAELDIPVLLMTGSRSPASGPAPARLLRGALRRCEWVAFDGLGHMGPITHPEPVNGAIAAFLARL